MNWQDAILEYFTPKSSPMLLVVDPDSLLQDDTLLAEIQNRNYDVLELHDEVSFRNLFERNYRSRWDAGEARHVVVIVHTTDSQHYVPFDLWEKSKRIELSVAGLFPNLNAIVVRDLDNAFYKELYPAHQLLLARHEMLRGERQTIEFILRVVFDLDPVKADNPARWVEFLIQKHYNARSLPTSLEKHVVEKLLPNVTHIGVRAEFINDAKAFYNWLGEGWAKYVAACQDSTSSVGIDFSDLRLRPMLGYLFAEGLIPRAAIEVRELSRDDDWMAIGLGIDKTQGGYKVAEDAVAQTIYNLKARLARFQNMDETTLPTGKTDLRDWLNLAAEWAEAIYLANRLPQETYTQIQSDVTAARSALDKHFWNFVQQRYSAVDHYQDNKGPISLVGLNRWLYETLKPRERMALICFDGMALDQWYLLRDFLAARLPNLQYEENRTYAVAPTITPISRQALFAGRPPTTFMNTIQKTDQDGKRWQAFWTNHDIPPLRIAYASVKTSDSDLSEVKTIVDSKNLRLGILINLFDDVMHGTEGMPADADKRIFYDTLISQLENSYLNHLFKLLLDAGYRIFLTADHGNIAGVGSGLKAS